MTKKLEKYEPIITFSLIIIYCLINSYIMNSFGLTSYKSIILNLVLVILIVLFIKINNLSYYYGLTKLPSPKKFLYFIPLMGIVSVNFWTGININNTLVEIICYMISMILVGFLEEVIFRGFLFKMMAHDNINRAIIVSSLTFGIGHILNLLTGASLIPTIMQIIYATCAGYLFIIIFIKSKSLWPCIITHSLINATSIFNNNNSYISMYIAPIFLIIISLIYANYLRKNPEVR